MTPHVDISNGKRTDPGLAEFAATIGHLPAPPTLHQAGAIIILIVLIALVSLI